jgi:hypothetical protein
MFTGSAASLLNAADRAAPIAPVTPAGRGEQRANAWIDVSWTEAPARPARIDPYGGDIDSSAAFVAQRYVQEEMPDAASAASLHQRGTQAYQTAQAASNQYQRGELGINLIA